MMRHFGTAKGGFVYFGSRTRVGYFSEDEALVIPAETSPGWDEPTAEQRDEARKLLAETFGCQVLIELRDNEARPMPPRFAPSEAF